MMEPQEIDPHLLNGALRQLIFFTGLDISNNAQHSAIFNAFVNKSEQRTAAAINYKMLLSVHFNSGRKSMSSSVESGGRGISPPFASKAEISGNSSIPLRNGAMAMVKRRWPLKYLEERPALIVTFVDLDWDHPAWLEMRTECENKINALRQNIGQRETKLALVLNQRQKAVTMDDPIANERALELCQHCRLNSRLLFVFPRLSDERAQIERVNRLEKAFHDIAQEFYHACFKKTRARSVPNNDPHLLVRQQFKLAFISELREDRHSALRYYKQAYQNCHESAVSDVDVYEQCSVASLLNYKICELNFVLNSAVEAIHQFRRHYAIFFKRESPVYPSRELAAIEMAWWKSQQCRLFAELFSRAVSNGLAAYPAQNPGRFLGEAATHYKKANALVRTLKAKLATTAQQRQTSPLADLSIPTTYYGQRPWRMVPQLADSASSKATIKLPALTSVNQQLLEHEAKLFLESNVRENYAQSLQLLSAAVAQFKRYGCERFANLSLFDMAEECTIAQQFTKALQILRRLCVEDQNVTFHPFLREALVAFANAAFCSLNLNEWTWSLLQLLHPLLANNSKKLPSTAVPSPSSAVKNCQGLWMQNFRNFLSGVEHCLPFPLMDPADGQHPLFSGEELDSLRHQWHQLFAPQPTASPPPQFQLDMATLSHSPIKFNARFIVISVAQQTQIYNGDELASISSDDTGDDLQIANAGDQIMIEIMLHNFSNMPMQFERCSLVLEEILQSSGAKKSITLSDWITAGNSLKNSALSLFPGRPLSVFFVYKTTLASSLKQLMQMTSSSSTAPSHRCHSPLTDAQNAKELKVSLRLFSLRSSSGQFNWEIGQSSSADDHRRQTPKWSPFTSSERMDRNCWAEPKESNFMVRPQRCNVLLNCLLLMDTAGLVLFVDESIELPFTLQNAEPNNDTVLKNIWVTCHKVCREDEEFSNQQQHEQSQLPSNTANPKTPTMATVVRRTFAAAPIRGVQQPQQQHQHQLLSVGDDKGSRPTTTTTLLVPLFSQEIATLLAQEQSSDFSVRLQSRSNNCIALRIHIGCNISSSTENELQPMEEPAELVKHFAIRCVEPFHPEITIFCENGEKAQCLVFGQLFRVQLQLKCDDRVTVHNVHWKLNDALFEHSKTLPLASSIEQQLSELKIMSTDPNEESLSTQSTWMEVKSGVGQSLLRETTANPSNGGEEQHQTQLGDVVVEWSSNLSLEHVRSALALPAMPPILAIPITIDVRLTNNEREHDIDELDMTNAKNGCCFRILQPFVLSYCLRNTSGGPLAVHLHFEQLEGISMDGIVEDSFLLFPDDKRVVEQCVVPVSLGIVNFPRPTIRCVSSVHDRADLEFSSEDLEQLNNLITTHTFNSTPKQLFILP